MNQAYHDASQELYDTPAMVCLAHGNFVPCRKQGEHRTSTDAADIEKVRYHQEVSVRLQSQPPAPPAPPEFRELDIPAEQWLYILSEEYGAPELRCGEQIIHEPASRPGRRYLTSCRTHFSAETPAELIAEIRRHILATPHFEEVPEGRYEVVPEG
jgi:hypothetical protein